ncbi:hypothetical protein EPO15_10660 [bacterium]|nr:MAG: hypothetical protein EPO15_10660 [bacterium]
MPPRSYEFTCKSCGKTVTESSESEVCSNCAASPMGAAPARPAAPPPPPVQKVAAPGTSAPKKPGFTITIKPKCDFCGGKGTVGSQPCPKCGVKK